MNLKYNDLSKDIQNLIISNRNEGWVNPYSCLNENSIRRNCSKDNNSLMRPSFVRDIEKILHLPAYNRYSDKTQVFSLYSNDDISRRSLHVQLVSRISRNLGSILGLNTDLIEAIALGHDLGHTPFGHAGENYLNQLLNDECGRHFNHNVQSVRILDTIYKRNISLQTLDGILTHNGEQEKQILYPSDQLSFSDFDDKMHKCINNGINEEVVLDPATLEGCVVRISDIIAYLGKDRQDAVKAKIINNKSTFTSNILGNDNAEIINNICVDIVENSYGKNYLAMSTQCFDAVKTIKSDNYNFIYKNKNVNDLLECYVKPMFSDIYHKLLSDLKHNNYDSPVFKHHIVYVMENTKYYSDYDYSNEDNNDIVTDYISSMTDDYFIKLYEFLFPDKKHGLEYKTYFNDLV